MVCVAEQKKIGKELIINKNLFLFTIFLKYNYFSV